MAAPSTNPRTVNRAQKRTLAAIRRMDQEQMISWYLELRDAGEADCREARRLAGEIVSSFSRMIGAVRWRHYYEIPAYVERTVDHDDLIAAGMAAEVRRCDPLKEYTRRQVRHTQKKKAELREELEREPADSEAACAVGVSVSKLKELEGAFCRAVSVDMPEWWEANEAELTEPEYEAVA